MSTRLRDSNLTWEQIGTGPKGLKMRVVGNHDVWGWFPPSHVLAPTARATDPVTSHQAAAAQTPAKVNDSHRLILALLRWEPMTDFDLARLASQHLKRKVLPTSLGVRRSELVKTGLVADSGTKGKSDTGSPAIKWCLTEAGMREVAA